MKLIIAGGRDYQLTPADYDKLHALHREHGVTLVLSGAARGADTCGEQWAARCGIPVQQYMAFWELWGKAAGFIRNRDMAEAADALAVFPGGTGTNHMFETASFRGLKIFDFRT